MSATTDTKTSYRTQIDEAAMNHPSHGLIMPPEDAKAGPLEEMAHQVLDDCAFNVIYDLLLSTFREEKVARCNTAAVLLEEKARDALEDDVTATNENLNHKAFEAKVATELVRFDEDGNTTLIQDGAFPHIMEAIPAVHCPECHLPRRLYPDAGEGSQMPEPGVQYCKKHVFVKNWPADIYNHTYTIDYKGVGKGNGGKKQKAELLNGGQDSPSASPVIDKDKSLGEVSAKCPIKDCTKHIPIKRMGNHLAKDHGTGRRTAQKDAIQKMQNSNGNGNNSSTSRKSTPTPSNNSKGRSSPTKRSIDEIDSDESPQKQKKTKPTAPLKKLQAPAMAKSSSQISSSNLNHVQTHPSDDEFIEDGDDDRDADFGSIAVEAKKKKKLIPKTMIKSKLLKNGDAPSLKENHKSKAAKTIAPASKNPRASTPSTTKSKLDLKIKFNGQTKKPPKARGDSESSQTLSSPN